MLHCVGSEDIVLNAMCFYTHVSILIQTANAARLTCAQAGRVQG
jgi:hypothetical protein